ncbi:type II toxin-antitoxin system Phd/YefM family antitoxin [Streptomyces poonensis]|uniref:Antitoxin n=1 Tax=Streptomyces poonensis TaxID=68255 RepID=A0A918P9M1_9ACTN|nr:type II toxin-antitoxin system prevent-host-death family antitoxin [Streptomyces poonensis]GGY90919.1 antitoxin YefM [Streptomyces poonensis]GLJ87898.1 antitoxin YefM [Streptomyces poonensis]
MSITASEARRRLFPLIEEVNSDRSAIEIVSKNGSAYLVAAEEYEALQETAYLLRSPANARRLLRSFQNALDGDYESRELIKDEDGGERL